MPGGGGGSSDFGGLKFSVSGFFGKESLAIVFLGALI